MSSQRDDKVVGRVKVEPAAVADMSRAKVPHLRPKLIWLQPKGRAEVPHAGKRVDRLDDVARLAA